jgi:DNA polymerase I-like protein with 3'-5' exonuclease and polymerase domains
MPPALRRRHHPLRDNADGQSTEALARDRLSARMLLQVHDELVFEAPDDEIEATKELAAKVMIEAPEPAVRMAVPLRVDARGGELGRGALRGG